MSVAPPGVHTARGVRAPLGAPMPTVLAYILALPRRLRLLASRRMNPRDPQSSADDVTFATDENPTETPPPLREGAAGGRRAGAGRPRAPFHRRARRPRSLRARRSRDDRLDDDRAGRRDGGEEDAQDARWRRAAGARSRWRAVRSRAP